MLQVILVSDKLSIYSEETGPRVALVVACYPDKSVGLSDVSVDG